MDWLAWLDYEKRLEYPKSIKKISIWVDALILTGALVVIIICKLLD